MCDALLCLLVAQPERLVAHQNEQVLDRRAGGNVGGLLTVLLLQVARDVVQRQRQAAGQQILVPETIGLGAHVASGSWLGQREDVLALGVDLDEACRHAWSVGLVRNGQTGQQRRSAREEHWRRHSNHLIVGAPHS